MTTRQQAVRGHRYDPCDICDVPACRECHQSHERAIPGYIWALMAAVIVLAIAVGWLTAEWGWTVRP